MINLDEADGPVFKINKGPQITQITRINGRKKAQKAQKCPQITQITQNEKDEKNLYRGCYVEPDRISSEEANTSYKVIYCVASLE